MLALASPAKLNQAVTHIARGWCDVATGAGGLASDDSKGSNKEPSSMSFGHGPILLTTGEHFQPEFLHRLQYVFHVELKGSFYYYLAGVVQIASTCFGTPALTTSTLTVVCKSKMIQNI